MTSLGREILRLFFRIPTLGIFILRLFFRILRLFFRSWVLLLPYPHGARNIFDFSDKKLYLCK